MRAVSWRKLGCLSLLRCSAFALNNTRTISAREYEGSRANSVVLNGEWEFAVGTGDEGADAAANQGQLRWRRVTLPGPFMPWNQEVANQTKFVWARRKFNGTQAG